MAHILSPPWDAGATVELHGPGNITADGRPCSLAPITTAVVMSTGTPSRNEVTFAAGTGRLIATALDGAGKRRNVQIVLGS